MNFLLFLLYKVDPEDFSDYFNFGGYLVDVDISDEKMMEFYKKFYSEISVLAKQLEQKIQS